MKSKTNRRHRRAHGELARPRSKRLLVSGSRFNPRKAAKERASRSAIADDALVEFFESLATEHPQVSKPVSGSIRFELEEGRRSERWGVTFTKGLVSSAGRWKGPADCIVYTDKGTLEGIIEGKLNAMAALLRGTVRVEGETLLMALLQSLLIKPAAAPLAQRLAKNMGRRA